MRSDANKSVECSVTQCRYHCDGENYCSLSRVKIGSNSCSPVDDSCTDCLSFAKK